MNLRFQNYLSLVEGMAAAVQGACSQLIDFSVGSVLRAITEATASVALWLQWLIAQTLSMTRAATSVGLDLDSFMADYGVSRLQAVAATGDVQFYRQFAGYATQIPVGTIVRTGDGLSLFTVTSDPTNAAYAAGVAAYLLPATALSVTVPVQAQIPGTSGNVLAGGIQLLSTSIGGVDGVTNPAALSGGLTRRPMRRCACGFNHSWTAGAARRRWRSVTRWHRCKLDCVGTWRRTWRFPVWRCRGILC